MSQPIPLLPTGTWQIYGNEEQGQLVISSVDNQGKLTGTAFGTEITGSYNASSGQIHFARQIKPNLADWQVYTGYISIVAINVDAPQYLLAGSYITIPFGLRHHFGWYATITKPLGGK
jgi:hypothetical protein